MPKKNPATDSAAATPVRAAKPKIRKTTAATEVVSKPRVKTVKHSKAAPVVQAVVEETAIVEAAGQTGYEKIAKIAYGYWEARGFQPGSPEQDWLRAEQEYLRSL
jgi:hypothetical protein